MSQTDTRIWARFACDVLANPKLRGLEPEAKWLYAAGILTSRRDLSDGYIHAPAVAVEQDVDIELIDLLVARGLWHRPGHNCPDCPQPEGRGWVYIHDFLEHQQSRAEVEKRKTDLAEYGRRGARKRWSEAGATAEAIADPMATAKATAKADAKASATRTSQNGQGHGQQHGQQHGQAIAEEEEEKAVAKSVGLSRSASSQSLTTNELAKITALTGGGPKHAEQTATFILSKAPADLRDPLAYVLAAVRNEPESYRYRRGNPKTADDMCPEHPGEWRDACRACAIDRRLEEVGDDWEPDWTEDL